MKLSRALLALVTASVLVLGAGATAASAAPAALPLTLLGPTSGHKLANPYPVFTWKAPAGDAGATIRIATASATKAGLLPDRGKAYLSVEDVAPGVSSYRLAHYAFSPGTYYWQVATTNAAGGAYVSGVRKFVVPVFFDLSKAKVKIARAKYNGKRVVQASAVMQCNYAQEQYYTEFTMDVYKGKKRVGRGMVAAGNCVGMYKMKQTAIYEVPASIKSGTKLTVKIYGQSTHNSTVRWGGAAIKKATGPKKTLTIRWKK